MQNRNANENENVNVDRTRIYRGFKFNNRKSVFYRELKKIATRLPCVSKNMEYDLVSNKIETGIINLFCEQLEIDDIYGMFQTDMEKMFRNSKRVRDSRKHKNRIIACDKSRKHLHKTMLAYFDKEFMKFTDVNNIEIPFIDDVRYQILKYVA